MLIILRTGSLKQVQVDSLPGDNLVPRPQWQKTREPAHWRRSQCDKREKSSGYHELAAGVAQAQCS